MAHVHGLRCRECGREYDDRPDLHLRVVLRPARGGLRLRRHPRPRSAARRSRPGPLVASGATPTCCPSTATRRSTSAPASRRWCAPTASPPSSASARCGSRTTPRNPTNSFKDRVVVGRAVEGARVRLQDRRVRVDRQPRRTRSPRTPRTPGCAATCSSPPTSSRARSSPPRSTAATSSRSTATTTTSTGSAPSSPAPTSGRSSTSTCGRSTPRARKTLAFETAEQLGWRVARPRGRADRERLAAHQDPQGLPRAAQGRPARRGAARARVGRAGRGLLADRDRVRSTESTRSGR